MRRIYAENIKSGGGKVLLDMVIDQYQNKNTIFYINEHIIDDIPKDVLKVTIDNKLHTRLLSRICIHKDNDHELHLGNLPPIITNADTTLIFLQNALQFVRLKTLFRENPRLIIRVLLERFFMKIFIRRHYILYVQTDFMKALVKQKFPKNEIHIAKFYPNHRLNKKISKCSNSKSQVNIVFVGGGEVYKNLKNVLSGLKKFVAAHQFECKLHIVGGNESLLTDQHLGYEVIFYNNISHLNSVSVIVKSDLMIFASELESFGMPLWEAHKMGIDIIASDRPFVLESCLPKASFDPSNANSLYFALCVYFGKTNVSNPNSSINFCNFS
jgi:hypothetical protein